MVQVRIREFQPIEGDKIYSFEVREVRNVFHIFWYWLKGEDKWIEQQNRRASTLPEAYEILGKFKTMYNPKYYR